MIEGMNFAIITLDSLRYDVAVSHDIESRFAYNWKKVYARADNTLPAHIALLHGGQFPFGFDDNQYSLDRRIMKLNLGWDKDKEAIYKLGDSNGLVWAFRDLNYYTVGIGGVGWFDKRYRTSNHIWSQMFSHFHWDRKFCEFDDHNFEKQISYLEKFNLKQFDGQLFLFINVASTHYPYMKNPVSKTGQKMAFHYVDNHIHELFSLLPKPCHVFIMADHGECFGEIYHGRELWGHGFFHEKVFEIPATNFILRE
jgi:hypothetical protein